VSVTQHSGTAVTQDNGTVMTQDDGRAVTHDSVVTAWREISACHAAACAALERELGERHGLGISDFEVSRLVDRLARHGLVERCGCDVDRRGIYVVLTEAGEQRHAEAVPTHRGVLARHLPVSMLSAASSGR